MSGSYVLPRNSSQLMDVAHIQHTTSQPEVLKQILKYSNICYFGIRMYFFGIQRLV